MGKNLLKKQRYTNQFLNCIQIVITSKNKKKKRKNPLNQNVAFIPRKIVKPNPRNSKRFPANAHRTLQRNSNSKKWKEDELFNYFQRKRNSFLRTSCGKSITVTPSSFIPLKKAPITFTTLTKLENTP